MNFFGHAVVAQALCDKRRTGSASTAQDAQVALGAMLPDFEGMVGEPAAQYQLPSVERGWRYHHATDAAFHRGPFFLEHQASAQRWFARTALRRGPRRAVSHVGVELILDAALARSPHRQEAYSAALLAGLSGNALDGARTVSRLKLNALLASLFARRARVVAGGPDDVAPRLWRALSQRPALSLREAELPLVAQWAHVAWDPIHARAERWLQRVVSDVDDELDRLSTHGGSQDVTP